MRFFAAVPLLALLAGCPSAPTPMPPSRGDFATLHSLMGENQKLVFTLQSHVGDPPDREAIRRTLDSMGGHFETVQRLQPYGDPERDDRLRGWAGPVARQLRELASADWSAATRK